jgi:hypothetical protein
MNDIKNSHCLSDLKPAEQIGSRPLPGTLAAVFNLLLRRIDGGTGKIRWRAITMLMTLVFGYAKRRRARASLERSGFGLS